ncbi:MAG: tyrosine-protein phosphatase [Chloroflexota bacterium]
MGRVDIHTHLLPAVDDGPTDIEDTLEMARRAAADGTEVMVATPHQRDVMLSSSVERLRGIIKDVNSRLQAEEDRPQGRVPRVLLGMENHIEPDLPEWLEDGRALPICQTRFVLSEPPFTAYSRYVDEILYRMQMMRYVPVIAHPERNVVLQHDTKKVRTLVERGMLIQVTAGSFLGEFGAEAQHAAESYLRHGLVHFIASDTHRPTEKRTPELSPSFARVAEIAGDEHARALFEDNPRMMLEGTNPEREMAQARERVTAELDSERRWWQFWRRSA